MNVIWVTLADANLTSLWN